MNMKPHRFFNTAGPVNCQKHYCLPPLERFNLQKILSLIEQEKYFVLHAPRQTGKTSSLQALRDELNREDKYHCLYINVELAQAAHSDIHRGIKAILSQLAFKAKNDLNDPFVKSIWQTVLEDSGEHAALLEVLTLWSQNTAKPIILLIDEIDALVGDSLIAVLRQLRTGYTQRPALFPQSVVLCGVRDVRDYRIHSDIGKTIITGGSTFNIKAESLRLGNFTAADIENLYQQHTEETGQVFEPGAIDCVWKMTQGQPWLVNALGYEVTFKIEMDRSVSISKEMILQAKENLILRRDTHLDQLTDKLKEERVQRVIQPILLGEETPLSPDDVQYVVDLGLLYRHRNGETEIANKIYQEVIPRELGWGFQMGLAQKAVWYINESDGQLNIDKLLTAFQDFFRENSEHWLQQYQYHEAGPHLLLQAFLQRIINGGGRVEREYGLGHKRTDLLILWPYSEGKQQVVIELKLLRGSRQATLAKGLKQTWEYMDTANSQEGHLLIFDRRVEKTWEEKIFKEEETYQNKKIIVWGM